MRNGNDMQSGYSSDMGAIDSYISGYWGKARRRGDKGPEWHPLAYHCLDVAAAGEAILAIRPEYLDAIAASSGLTTDLARRSFLFALALHDVGKFADCFQEKWQRLAPSAMSNDPTGDPGHGAVGSALWACSCDFDVPYDEGRFSHHFRSAGVGTGYVVGFTTWLEAVFGHHGRPVTRPPTLASLMSRQAAGHAREFVEACAALFEPAAASGTSLPPAYRFKQSSWLVAGLAIVADWIGSNQDEGWFPYLEPEPPLDLYWPIAQQRAASAIRYAGLGRPPIALAFGLREALHARRDAMIDQTPLQGWMADEFKPNGQTLVVIEDLTGAGKTEAALIAAHRLMRTGAAEGLYWALPTMATSNSLYTRLHQAYESLFEYPAQASLVLAHGKRDFNIVFRDSVLPAGHPEAPRGTTVDDEPSTAQCAAWIADDRRKTFLADVGVGTLDQALLGILPVKHQAIRIAALARRVLVVDEAHSYDPYTSALLQTLLTFHAANGGSAILLTATLTQALRRQLVAAFEKGARWRADEPSSNAFPLITVASQDSFAEHAVASSRGTRRDLRVERIGSEEEAVALLLTSQRRGEAAVWIRNTVHDAIQAYHRLREALPGQVDLFHARFALGDRMERETSAVGSYGKGDPPNRNRILVATQVVEQSLDLDFDVMVSDLAPIDLLIQRAGRLHRHDRGDRPAPVLHVLGPAPIADAKATWFSGMFQKGQYVYADHGRLWLTMHYVLDVGGLMLASRPPREPIEAVFSEDPDLPEGLRAIADNAAGQDLAAGGLAKLNALQLKDGYAQSSGAWASDTVTPTRLGSPQRLVRLARWNGARLEPWFVDADAETAWRLSEIQVLASRVADVSASPDIRKAVDALVASWPQKFDPPLVVPLVLRDDLWCAEAIDAAGNPVAITYSPAVGLEFNASPLRDRDTTARST